MISLKTIQDLLGVASSVVDLIKKIKEAKKEISECNHTFTLTHNESLGAVHVDETFCPCKPYYRCFMCGKVPSIQASK